MKYNITVITDNTFFDCNDLSEEDLIFLFESLQKEDKYLMLPKPVGKISQGICFKSKDIKQIAIRIF